ncbi:MAG TPA: hypothetical protein EYH31_05665 [Anaerolineae bacterium]|nr:hypothetical protein [Anaerolineae bacterium]
MRVFVLMRLALALVLLLSGSCHFPGSTRPLLKIGLIAPFEGLYRSLGYEVLYAVKLAVRQRNAAGGVAGYGVELVALNDNGDSALAARVAAKLAVDRDVMGALGPWSVAGAAQALPVFVGSEMPWLVPVPLSDLALAAGRPYAFRLSAGPQLLAQTAVEWALSAGAERVLVSDVGDLALAFRAAAERCGVYAPMRDLEAGEWSKVMVALGGNAAQIADELLALAATGYRGLAIAGPEGGLSIVKQRAGSAANALFWFGSMPPVSEGWSTSFTAEYVALAGQPPGPYAALAYDAANVLLNAIAAGIAQSEKPERAVVADALADTDYTGLSGSIAFDAAGAWQDAPVYVQRSTAMEEASRAPCEATPKHGQRRHARLPGGVGAASASRETRHEQRATSNE